MKITAKQIKTIRDSTGAPISRAKQVLEETKGDEKKSIAILLKEGHEKMAKRENRETSQGIVASYTHHSGKIGVLVSLLCETDFVAKNELFRKLANDLTLQIASMKPKNVKDLLQQDHIKDTSKKIEELVKEVSIKTGENIKIGDFQRVEIK